jgi:hypothetical protein
MRAAPAALRVLPSPPAARRAPTIEPTRPDYRPSEVAPAEPVGLPPLTLPPRLAALVAGEAAPALDAAPQRQDRIHLVPNALEAARGAAPHLEQLARLILPRMPRKLSASSSLHTPAACSGLLWLDGAIKAQHFAVKTKTHQHAIVVDVDHSDWAELLETLAGYGLPRPTWVCADPWKSSAHAVWWLRDPVCITAKGREAPRRMLDIVARLLTTALRGDPAYSGSMTKNPWAPGPAPTRAGEPAIPALWAAHQETAPALRHAVIARAPELHDLGTLRRALLRWQDAAEVPTPGRRRPVVTAENSEKGRRLFDAARHRVYASWPLTADQVAGIAAEEAAALGSPITPRQLAGMARRMHAWMTRHYRVDAGRRRADGSPMHRGRDRLEGASLDLCERQAVAARRTAEGRRKASAEAARAALARLTATGQRATQAAVAAAAGLSERTVRGLWVELSPAQKPARRCRSVRAERSDAPAPPQAGPLPDSEISLCLPSLSAIPSGTQAQPSPPAPAPALDGVLRASPGGLAARLLPEAPDPVPVPSARAMEGPTGLPTAVAAELRQHLPGTGAGGCAGPPLIGMHNIVRSGAEPSEASLSKSALDRHKRGKTGY